MKKKTKKIISFVGYTPNEMHNPEKRRVTSSQGKIGKWFSMKQSHEELINDYNKNTVCKKVVFFEENVFFSCN